MSQHAHTWNPKTFICTSCGISYAAAWKNFKAESFQRIEVRVVRANKEGDPVFVQPRGEA